MTGCSPPHAPSGAAALVLPSVQVGPAVLGDGDDVARSSDLADAVRHWAEPSESPSTDLEILAAAVQIVAHRYSAAGVDVALLDGESARIAPTVIEPTTSFGELVASIGERSVTAHSADVVVLAGDPDPVAGVERFPARLTVGLASDAVWVRARDHDLPLPVADRFLEHLRTLLGNADPQSPMPAAELAILSVGEVEQLDEWNNTERNYPLDLSFAEAFERQVDCTPDSTAIREGRSRLTYRELDRRGNAIATALNARGLGADDVVAVAADRSMATEVAIVGVLKSGAAYLPLDGSHPVLRLAAAMSIGEPDLVIAQTEHATTISEAIVESGEAIDVISLDDLDALEPVSDRLAVERHASDLAYVIPTSGSTGSPKAAMVEQRAMMNHAWAMIEALDLSETDVIGQSAPLTFDISIWQMLTPLLIGGQVAYAADDARSAPDRLLAWIDDHLLTVVQLVPSLMSSVLQIAEVDDGLRLGPSLRWVIPTGEALPPDVARRWLERFAKPPLVNAYGPAECADDVTLAFVDEAPDPDVRSVPIGRPVGNVATYVLDPAGGRLPIGVVGEIAVGGMAVGRGYRGDPARTAEAFETNPYPPYGTRYRTGDLGRFLADGSLEYVGREDHQVKIRGQRIELGDVESAVAAHPLVDRAVAIASTGELVAFYTTVAGEAPAGEIQSYVAERLPPHMQPKTLAPIERFPLNANGKVDRKSLEALVPEVGLSNDQTDLVAATTDTERALATIWSRVLEAPAAQIGVHDDFFDLGGTSLSAAVMLWHIDRDLDVDLPLSAPIERRTIAALASLVEQRSSNTSDPAAPELVDLAPDGDRIPLFMAAGQGGSVLGFVPLSRHIDSDQPLLGLDLQRRRDIEAPPQTFESLVDHHYAAIKARFPDGPYIVGGWCMGGEVAMELARRLRSEGDQVPLVVMLQTEHVSYPDYPSGTGSVARLRHAVLDRLGYELSTLRNMASSQRTTYLSEQLLAKAVGKVTVPIERRLVPAFDKLGRSYRGSERYHRKRWMIADGAVYDDYTYPPYDGDVLVMYAKNQPRAIVPDPSLGWASTVTGTLHLAEIDGYHWNILREPQIVEVAAALEVVLSPLNHSHR